MPNSADTLPKENLKAISAEARCTLRGLINPASGDYDKEDLMSRWLWLCMLLFGSGVCAQGQLQFSAPWGPHAIGFKVVHLLDSSRSWSDGHDPLTGVPVTAMPERPLQVLVWYPASAAGKPMVYADYLALLASEDGAVNDPALIQRVVDGQIRAWAGADPLSGYQVIAAQPIHATTAATPAAGSFPLVIYAPSDSNASFEDDVLCEYLASRGYVVISTSSRGAHLPYMTNEQMPVDMANTRAQAADIGVLIGQAEKLAVVDTDKIAVLGYSWGGMASTFAATADDRIKLLVDLDGSVRYYPKLLAMRLILRLIASRCRCFFLLTRKIRSLRKKMISRAVSSTVSSMPMSPPSGCVTCNMMTSPVTACASATITPMDQRRRSSVAKAIRG